nr:putative integron gene cassette protein [uncultured bacterium]
MPTLRSTSPRGGSSFGTAIAVDRLVGPVTPALPLERASLGATAFWFCRLQSGKHTITIQAEECQASFLLTCRRVLPPPQAAPFGDRGHLNYSWSRIARTTAPRC